MAKPQNSKAAKKATAKATANKPMDKLADNTTPIGNGNKQILASLFVTIHCIATGKSLQDYSTPFTAWHNYVILTSMHLATYIKQGVPYSVDWIKNGCRVYALHASQGINGNSRHAWAIKSLAKATDKDIALATQAYTQASGQAVNMDAIKKAIAS